MAPIVEANAQNRGLAFPDSINRIIIDAHANPERYNYLISADSLVCLLDRWNKSELDTVSVDSTVILGGVIWHGTADLDSASVSRRYFNIRNCITLGHVDLSRARFSGDVSFQTTIFLKDANFRHTTFSGNASLGGTIFAGDVDFSFTTFSEWVGILVTQFFGNVDFSYATFSGYSEFLGAEFMSATDLSGAEFSEGADFEYAAFSGVVGLMGTRFFRGVTITWKQLHGHEVCFSSDYMEFLRIFRESADRDSERECDFDRKCALLWLRDKEIAVSDGMRLRKRPRDAWLAGAISHPGEFFSWAICGFGYRPVRSALPGVAIILIFAFAFWDRNAAKYRITRDEETERFPLSFRDALYFSINTFCTVGYGDWEPMVRPLVDFPSRTMRWFKRSTRGRLRNPLLPKHSRTNRILWASSWPVRYLVHQLGVSGRELAVLEGVLGWLVLALFIATLTKLWL